jgi:hypothetical protein
MCVVMGFVFFFCCLGTRPSQVNDSRAYTSLATCERLCFSGKRRRTRFPNHLIGEEAPFFVCSFVRSFVQTCSVFRFLKAHMYSRQDCRLTGNLRSGMFGSNERNATRAWEQTWRSNGHDHASLYYLLSRRLSVGRE